MKTKIFAIQYKMLVYTVLSVIILSSCQKVIDLNIEKKDEKIVMNSVLQNGEKIKINLSKSKSVLDDKKAIYISNANITLKDNGNVINNIEYKGDGTYLFDNIAQANHTYSINVSSNNMKSISAKTEIYSPVSFKIIDTSTTDFYEYTYLDITIKLNNTEKDSYYFLSCVDKDTNSIYMETSDINAEKELYEEFILFNNKIAGSGNLNFKFRIDTYYIFNNDNDEYYTNKNISETKSIYIILSRVDFAYYKYILSKNKYMQTVNDPFSEPVQVYNNIENGFGIFGSKSSSVDSLIFTLNIY